MTQSSISLVDLDFENFKQSLKEYLRNRPEFKDYDFEGANMNVLLDILSYNSYKNAFYYNMAIGEGFLDSAQLRPSVVSRAKELNYTPRSTRSSKAKVTVTFEADGSSAPYVIQKGAPFTALVKNQTFTFTTPENIIVSSANNTYSFTTNIYEGIYLQDIYTVQETNEEFPRYRITNDNCDTSSLTVAVYEDGSDTAQIYRLTDTLLGLTELSQVYFLQAIENGYEVTFGDNFFGKKPKAGSTIILDYRIAQGAVADGATTFSVDFDPSGNDELLSSPTLTVVEPSTDGLNPQGIESIRVYAPRYFATQQRAVSSDDYASLILSKFSGTIDDVNVYGGENVEPRLYGRVLIALKPTNGTIAPEFIKDEIETYLKPYVSLPTRVITVDPDIFHVYVDTTVNYNVFVTNKTSNEIKGIVAAAIQDFSTVNLEKFSSDFRFSRFVNTIDEADGSIISNDTSIRIIKRMYPKTYAFFTATINFGNELDVSRSVFSSAFTYIDENSVEYDFAYIRDDKQGKLLVYAVQNATEIVLNSNIGSVDYATGKVIIRKLLTAKYGPHLDLYAYIANKDIRINNDKVLYIDPADVNITVVGSNR